MKQRNLAVSILGSVVALACHSSHAATLDQYGVPIDLDGAKDVLVADFDGDGADDLLFLSVSTEHGWYVSWNGDTALQKWKAGNYTQFHDDQYLVGDFDGDGRDDVFTMQGRDWWVAYSNGREVAPSWVRVKAGVDATVLGLQQLAVANVSNHSGEVRPIDDLVWFSESDKGVGVWLGQARRDTQAFVGRYDRWLTGYYATRPKSAYLIHDFDNNGLSDAFLNTGSEWQVAYGFKNWVRTRAGVSKPAELMRAANVYGSTYPDIVWFTEDSSAGWRQWIGTGLATPDAGFNGFSTLASGQGTGHQVEQYLIGDFDGNGLDEIGFFTDDNEFRKWEDGRGWRSGVVVPPYAYTLRPIVFVPGTMASKVFPTHPDAYNPGDPEVWADLTIQLIDDDEIRLNLRQNVVGSSTKESPQIVPHYATGGWRVNDSAASDGGVSSIVFDGADFYAPTIEWFENKGFRRGEHLFIAHYIWFDSYANNCAKLSASVDQALMKSHADAALLMGHSQGTQVIDYCITHGGLDQAKVAAIMHFAPPAAGGSPDMTTYNTYKYGAGNSDGVTFVSDATVKQLSEESPAMYLMGPMTRYSELLTQSHSEFTSPLYEVSYEYNWYGSLESEQWTPKRNATSSEIASFIRNRSFSAKLFDHARYAYETSKDALSVLSSGGRPGFDIPLLLTCGGGQATAISRRVEKTYYEGLLVWSGVVDWLGEGDGRVADFSCRDDFERSASNDRRFARQNFEHTDLIEIGLSSNPHLSQFINDYKYLGVEPSASSKGQIGADDLAIDVPELQSVGSPYKTVSLQVFADEELLSKLDIVSPNCGAPEENRSERSTRLMFDESRRPSQSASFKLESIREHGQGRHSRMIRLNSDRQGRFPAACKLDVTANSGPVLVSVMRHDQARAEPEFLGVIRDSGPFIEIDVSETGDPIINGRTAERRPDWLADVARYLVPATE